MMAEFGMFYKLKKDNSDGKTMFGLFLFIK